MYGERRLRTGSADVRPPIACQQGAEYVVVLAVRAAKYLRLLGPIMRKDALRSQNDMAAAFPHAERSSCRLQAKLGCLTAGITLVSMTDITTMCCTMPVECLLRSPDPLLHNHHIRSRELFRHNGGDKGTHQQRREDRRLGKLSTYLFVESLDTNGGDRPTSPRSRSFAALRPSMRLSSRNAQGYSTRPPFASSLASCSDASLRR